jgi:hypothetical protein
MPAFDRISMDTVGPFPTTPRGNKFVVIAVDGGLTRWVEAWAIPDKSAEIVARFVKTDIISRHGTPAIILCDGGPEFRGDFMELLTRNGIKQSVSSAYRPTANGAAERVVQQVLHGLQRSAAKDDKNWDLELPEVLQGIRMAKHTTTRFSPFFLTYGRRPILPFERSLMPNDQEQGQEEEPEHVTNQQLQTRADTLNAAAATASGQHCSCPRAAKERLQAPPWTSHRGPRRENASGQHGAATGASKITEEVGCQI